MKIKERFIDQAQLTEGDVKGKYLPRNVIFNKYFNKHNIMVITPRNLHNYEAAAQDNITDWVTDKGTTRTDQLDYYRGTNMDSTSELPGFVKIGKNTDEIKSTFYNDDGNQITDDKVLRDENGRVILVFRSGTGDSSSNDAYQGIHFVVIERSPFIKEETDEGTKKTKLEEYYTHYSPPSIAYASAIACFSVQYGISYSQFMGQLAKKNIGLNRKVLADLAMNNPKAFEAIIKSVSK